MTSSSAAPDPSSGPPGPFAGLAFVHPWRTYQRLVLRRVEQVEDPSRLHLVAPPGSGKTILGLELARRRDRPTLVLSPTATIAAQWRGQVRHFSADPEVVSRTTSDDPSAPAALTSLTYQRLGVLDAADDVLVAAARDAWATELVHDGQVEDAEAAAARIVAMEAANPANHARALRRHVRRERRRLIDEGGVLERLHPNARALIERLAEHDVGTLVLDECHHLLDHWALAVRALLERLDDVQVIGLTATLPDLDDQRSHANYTGLLGEVTYEVPTPAVVKAGDLAPWRDLVVFTAPEADERAVLDDAEAAFRTVTGRLLGDDRLARFAEVSAFGDAVSDARVDRELAASTYAALLCDRPLFAVAAGRLLVAGGRWPGGVPVPSELDEPPGFEDELLLFERFGLDVLAVSDRDEDHELLRELRGALHAFGLTLTERGLRQGRSVGDLVLAFSRSKDTATVDVLAREADDLGDRLRAVVVTDFAERSSAVARVDGPLDTDAGSAVRVFHAIVADPRTDRLDAMLVTGRTVLVDADHGDELVVALNGQLVEDGLDARCRYEPTDDPAVLEVVGEGPDWSSATYVRLLTEVFESGVTRCLVGTRGLFGEGWDALGLNTLVDLTSVTTSTGVQQLRGRSLRLDPTWPRKVAHNWDVICVDADHERGTSDLDRLVRRHAHLWGVLDDDRDRLPAVELTDLDGTRRTVRPAPVVRGIASVVPRFAEDVLARGGAHRRLPFRRYTGASLAAIGDRARSHDLWAVGVDHADVAYHGTRLRVDDLRVRTVHTVQETLHGLLRRLGILFAALVAEVALVAGVVGLRDGLVVAGAVTVVTVGVWVWSTRRLLRRTAALLLWEQPPDEVVRDVADAVLEGLRGADVLPSAIEPEQIRVVWTPDRQLDVLLDHVEEEAGAVFARALGETLGPVEDPRYVIRRTDGRMPTLRATALWGTLRAFVWSRRGRASWHPVPTVLGARREDADAFAAAWRTHVGGGELVFTRSDEGRRVLLDARADRRTAAGVTPYERWR